VEFRVVDASLARALYHGIPAARLLARSRPVAGDADARATWDARMRALLGPSYDRVEKAMARHARVALDEGLLTANEGTVAVLAWAVACAPENDASLAELAPAAGEPSSCDESVLAACAAYDERLAHPAADKRAPAFEACIRLATRASLGPLPWERVRAISTQLERSEIGVRLLGERPASIFPRRVDDEITASDRRMAAVDRGPLDALVAKDPRQLAATIVRMDPRAEGASVQLATFLADLARMLVHEGTMVVALSTPEPQEEDAHDDAPAWFPTEWTRATATVLADAIERGVVTFPRVRAAAVRGGEAALDAIGAEMLDVVGHASASAAFAEILSRSGRPRDVLRLVAYFAIAPDPALAARALATCWAAELPRVLSAWLNAMLPQDGDEAPESSAARVTACIASLKPYPELYRAVRPLLSRLDLEPASTP
jgi:hypothetical protein